MIEGLTVAVLVHNDQGRVGRALASARSVADRWLVIDTGSTDGTVEEVRRATRGWPGQLLRRPWVDAGSNRTDLVATGAESGARWLLVLDADDELVEHDQLAVILARTQADALQLPYATGPARWVSRLLRCGLPWLYLGAVRAHLDCGMPYRAQRLVNPRLADRTDPATRTARWQREVGLLQAELASDPTRAQAWFDLGETRRGLRQAPLAVDAYQRCVSTAPPGELRYLALLYAGCLQIALQRNREAAELLRQAIIERPQRREALLQLCQLLNRRRRHAKVLQLLGATGELGRPIPLHDVEGLFAPAYSGELLVAERVRAVNAVGGRAARFAGPSVTGDPRLHQDAECGLPTSTLFDERYEDERPADYLRRLYWSQWVCLDCPVAQACERYGERHRLPGVFGGRLRTKADNQLAVAAS
jgi:tetratricopeptide (TPR) repeat protein